MKYLQYTSTLLGGMLAICLSAAAQQDIDRLRQQGAAEGWTFSMRETKAAALPRDARTGLRAPADWRKKARFVSFDGKAVLPPALDLRPYCPPVRDQGGCGSCWAFATVGALECNIGLRDGAVVDLSEQWLVSCNTETEEPPAKGMWNCVNGGWWAHDYHAWKPDDCGGFGAVLEADFPYAADDLPCACPYPHSYWIDAWAYVGGEEEIPSTDAIKQAILEYGPVSVAIYTSTSFVYYDEGVFNDPAIDEVDHAVVLVGWDDNLGAKGAWILRNSWGASWGVDGHMYIEYGCADVGLGACFVDYPGAGVAGEGPAIVRGPGNTRAEAGGFCALRVQAEGVGALHYQWRKEGAPIGEDSPALYLDPVAYEDAGQYTCAVTDLRGTTESPAALLEVLEPGSLPLATPALLAALGAAILGAAGIKRVRRRLLWPVS